MIKIGDTVNAIYGEATQLWLTKQPGLKKYTDEIYVVLAFIPGKGRFTANNGTLKNMRAWIKQHM